MSRKSFTFTNRNGQIVQWFLLFTAVALALWAVTHYQTAPPLILLGLLTIIALNFSLPPRHGGGGLVPAVIVSGLLMMGLETAVILYLAAFILSELTHPLWAPVWEDEDGRRPFLWERLGQGLIYLLPLLIGGAIYRQLGGAAPLSGAELDNLTPLAGLIGGYGAGYFLLSAGYWMVLGRPFPQFLTDAALANIAYGFLALPAAILGSFTFLSSGLPAFIIFALGVTVFSVVIRLSWQRRLTLEQRLQQFAALNQAGQSLRETLDLAEVLARTRQQIKNLVPADKISISLVNKPQITPITQIKSAPSAPSVDFHSFVVGCAHVVSLPNEEPALQPSAFSLHHLDDFTRWVVENGRVLDLDSGNMHFADRHNLTPPAPTPSVWLGIPLMAAEQVIGALVLQRLAPGRPFTQWNRELLLAMAGQVSAAIQNARLYSRTDEALARRVEQLQALLDGMQEGVLMVDMNGRIPLINPFAATLLGQPAAALRQTELQPEQVAHIGYAKEDWQEQLTALKAGQAPNTDTHIFPTRLSEKPHFVLRQETAVYAANGQVMGWLILFRDVTEEQALAERRADLTRMIVHDLRNPLTTMLSALQLTTRHPHDTDAPLNHVRQGALDMLDMVDSLMDINRMEAGQPVVDAEAMRLPPLIDKVMARLRPLADKKQITLHFDIPPNLPAVWGDVEILRRVLINLLDNGLKFTPAGGSVNGRLQIEPPSPNREPGIRCIIQDTGPGIPPDHRDYVFERYTRANPGGALVRGTGLGLTFCKLAVEGHNGRIWVEDAPGGGSQFVFTLPGLPNLEI